MVVDARTRAWLALQLLEGIGTQRLHSLLSAFGSPDAVVGAGAAALSRLVGADLAGVIARGPESGRLAASLAWLEQPDCALIAWDDADYPPGLLRIPDPPPALFFRGRRELLTRPAIAIVGSRRATPQGLENAEAFARALGEAGLTIVSGLALGIDAAAHRGGLDTPGSSIAVVATGLDRVYPAANRPLAQRLGSEGGLVSEFAVGTPALAGHFPRRNRLISGIARGVLVVEATLDSGSLITARLAGEQGREVFAIPGSIHSPFARGCHRLIKDGAKLVETAEDVLAELRFGRLAAGDDRIRDVAVAAAGTTGYGARAHGPGTAGPGAVGPAAGEPGADGTVSPAAMFPPESDEAALLVALGHDPADVDTLSRRTGLSPARIRAAITVLELAGRLAGFPGARYARRGRD